MKKNQYICPKCKKPQTFFYKIYNGGWQKWSYPIKNNKVDLDGSDIVKSDWDEIYFECPECKQRISEEELKFLDFEE